MNGLCGQLLFLAKKFHWPRRAQLVLVRRLPWMGDVHAAVHSVLKCVCSLKEDGTFYRLRMSDDGRTAALPVGSNLEEREERKHLELDALRAAIAAGRSSGPAKPADGFLSAPMITPSWIH